MQPRWVRCIARSTSRLGARSRSKVLHPKLLEDRKVARRFVREAELAGRLRRPNVIGVVDVDETTDGLHLDFAEGRDLAAFLDQAPMPPARVIG